MESSSEALHGAEPAVGHPVSREVVWSGGVFGLMVPADAEVMPGQFVGHEYVRFPRWAVRGGWVSRYLHPADGTSVRDLLGTRIAARVELIKKVYPEGREHVYVDFRPVEGERATHALAVLSSPGEVARQQVVGGEILRFDLPPTQGQGVILIGAKVPKPRKNPDAAQS